MVDSIAKTLGAGSGIDVTALVTSLVDAQYAVKTQALTRRADTLTAQVSAVSNLKSGISGFAAALANLVKGGTLTTQPTSANTGIVKTSALPGAKLSNLAASIEVRALAAAQVAATKTGIAAATALGAGSLTFQFGKVDDGGVFQPDGTALDPITVDANDTLATLAVKINAANQGVTASVVSDSTGDRLVMKGASGAARAFTLTASGDSADAVKALEVGAGKTGTELATTAADAVVAVDGVAVTRASNSISDLIPGVRLDLQAAAIGTKVAIGSTTPTDALSQAANDVVATYNELYATLKTATNPVDGALRSDPAARDMLRSLARMTTTDLTGATDGSPNTLGSIGIATARDGTLSVTAATLATALKNHPQAVEAIFADGTGATGHGLSGVLSALSATLTSKTYGLGASETRYTKAQSTLTDDQAKASDSEEKLRTRLTQQYASMDSRVAAYKSTQTFLQQQVDAWNAN